MLEHFDGRIFKMRHQNRRGDFSSLARRYGVAGIRAGHVVTLPGGRGSDNAGERKPVRVTVEHFGLTVAAGKGGSRWSKF